ncbi:MAG: PilZ domain-containing protein [Trichlorobacter sp.]|jgi:hypothetical protein|nr:PilZ domain-containing protein [Trichlorobacter sp.]
MKETYQLASIKDGKQDFTAIMEVLKDIHSGKRKNDLRLINYYHEVPVSYPISMEYVDSEMLDLKVNQAQAVVLSVQKQALLTSSSFPKELGVHAIVERVNVPKCAVTLGRFAYASIRAERREAVRVTVDERVEAVFEAVQEEGREPQILDGNLNDISLTGFSMLSDCPLPSGIPEQGTARLTLANTCLSLPAYRISNRRAESGNLYMFRIDVDRQADKVISQYIYNRQVEIIHALKEQFG